MSAWNPSPVLLPLVVFFFPMLVTEIRQHTNGCNASGRNVECRISQAYRALYAHVRVDDKVPLCCRSFVLAFASIRSERLVVISKDEAPLKCIPTLIAEIGPALRTLHVVAPNRALDWDVASGAVVAVSGRLSLGTTSAFDPFMEHFVPAPMVLA